MIDPLTMYLAKLIGFSIGFFGLAMIVRTGNFQKTISQISKSDAMMTLISIFPLVAGFAIVLAHNVWVKDWSVVITIIGWIILLIGLARLFYHKALMHQMAKKAKSKEFFKVLGIVLVIIGAYLVYMGFDGRF
jgi:hypothetical protein